MRKTHIYICCLILIFFSLTVLKAQNPTGFCTVLRQPCDSNGILAATITSGMILPLTFEYYNALTYASIVHDSIYAFSDTLSNFIFGRYYVQITDSAGVHLLLSCQLNAPFSVDYPRITNPVCPNTLGTAKLTINGGDMPLSVQWYLAGRPYPGQFSATGNPAQLAAGRYHALVKDTNGCIMGTYDSVSDIIITQLVHTTFDIISTPANCTNVTASIINLTGGVTPYAFTWSNGSHGSSINNLSTGHYEVTVTDSLGCSKSDFAYVDQTTNIIVFATITNATCLGNDGSVIVFGSHGTPPYTYIYSNGYSGPSITGLTGGTQLYVTAIDSNGCIGHRHVNIGTTTPITVQCTTTQSSCTVATGSATLTISGGTPPYTVVWNSAPPQYGLTLNNVPPGNYSFLVTDSVGCVRTGVANVPAFSTINTYIDSWNAMCPRNDGQIDVNVSGSHPPFTYHWNTGAVTSNINNLAGGYYLCTITDSVGCTVKKGVTVESTSPVHIGFVLNPSSCIFSNDGSIRLIAAGGRPPYSYYWSNGQTGSSISGLTPGGYSVYVRDSLGCSCNGYTSLDYNQNNDSCYCTIKGKVFVDLNNNCIYDPGEAPVEHIMMHCSGMGYSFTDANGNYSFLVPSGNYTLSEMVQSIYPLAPCQNNNINLNVTSSPGCVLANDFANVINPLHDIRIFRTGLYPAIPGNSYYQKLIIENEGTINEPDIQLRFEHDGQLMYNGTSPNVFTQLNPLLSPYWYSVNSGFPAILPGNAAVINTTYLVPTDIPLETSVDFYDTSAYSPPMSNWLTDYTPWNNVSSYRSVIVGSFDPNYKEVSPKGVKEEGYILRTDSILTYIIHFQNTGNYFANKVVITDTLDGNLSWSTLRPGYSDHKYIAEMSENGVVKFTFENINLDFADDYYGDITSLGMVTYSVMLKDNLPAGTQIKNRAAIYFDFNAPVLTNTTLNKLVDIIPDGINDVQPPVPDKLFIYPNPANSQITIDYPAYSPSDKPTMELWSVSGSLLQSLPLQANKTRINISDLPAGIYIVKVMDAADMTVKKIVKE